MNGRWMQSLRGVKISVFALAVLGASLAGSLVHARPASAEGFLQKTVKCVLGALVLYDCREPAPTPSSPVAPTIPQANEPVSPTPSPATSTPSGSSSSGQAGQTQEAQGSPPVAYVAPLPTDEVKTPDTMPSVPAAAYKYPFRYEPTQYASAVYKTFGQAYESDESAAVLQASEEGWRLFGVAWYWWLGGIAIAAGLFQIIYQRSIRRLSAL